MSKSIKLHPEKGLNPHMTFCPRCGADGQELLLLGDSNKVYECLNCGMKHVGYPRGGLCRKCGHKVKFEREIEDSERLPGGLCDACEKEVAAFKEVVDAGGIYFRCKDCGTEGVIKKDNPICADVREKMGIKPPDPCGLEVTKEECPVCLSSSKKQSEA